MNEKFDDEVSAEPWVDATLPWGIMSIGQSILNENKVTLNFGFGEDDEFIAEPGFHIFYDCSIEIARGDGTAPEPDELVNLLKGLLQDLVDQKEPYGRKVQQQIFDHLRSNGYQVDDRDYKPAES